MNDIRDHLDARLDDLAGRVDARLDALTARFDRRFDALDEKFGTQGRQLAAAKTDIRYLKGFRNTVIGLFLALASFMFRGYIGLGK